MLKVELDPAGGILELSFSFGPQFRIWRTDVFPYGFYFPRFSIRISYLFLKLSTEFHPPVVELI